VLAEVNAMPLLPELGPSGRLLLQTWRS